MRRVQGWLDLTCGGDEARTLLLRGRLIRRLGRFRRAKLLQREAVCYICGHVPSEGFQAFGGGNASTTATEFS